MNPTSRIGFLQIAAAGLFLTLWACTDADTGRSAKGASASSIPSVESLQQWENILSASESGLLVAEFYAQWCAPCREMAPILEALSEKYRNRVLFYRIDIDAQRSLSEPYRVRGIPFTVLIRNREVVDSLLGVHSKRRLSERIERYVEP
ncbi:MAG: thioredoxin family protein [Desulfobacterales bacterium]|nr:thioredoxin family protein [Desulfobacterales bacterium]MCF8080093.1 thioredoxin family protein [Desulfobacterales bacterium]